MHLYSTFKLTSLAALVFSSLLIGCSRSPPSVPVASPASAPALQVSDVDVTEHVRTALLQSASLKGADIQVVTIKGDVRLTGMLDTQLQIDTALGIARAADGAHAIHDELTLRK